MHTMPVDEGMMKFYKALQAKTPPEAVTWPLGRQRSEWDAVCREFRAPVPRNIRIDDREVGGVHIRIFRPQGDVLKPGFIYFHGGGWVLGSIETHHDMCAEMAAEADVVTVAVDYRLAPEHPHPAQMEDALTVLDWMRKDGAMIGIDVARICGGGDSAGGQMTAGLTLMLRDRRLPQLSGQILIYPVLGADIETRSYTANADAPCLTKAEMDYYLEAFLGPRGGPNWSDPYAIPLLARDLSNLPPAFITVAAHDPLHDDGVAYHERLLASGTRSLLRREPALAHSYMRARHVSAPAMAGFKAITGALRSLAGEGKLPG